MTHSANSAKHLPAGQERLAGKSLFLFDIDGTLALDTTLFTGTRELLDWLEATGRTAVFITNNSTKSRRSYVEKFARWGFAYGEERFITSTYVTVDYLQQHHAGELIFLLGTESLKTELQNAGIRITEDPKDPATVALVGYDSELTYQKTRDICDLLTRHPETTYLATHPDLCCPAIFDGVPGMVPDCGAICQLLYCALKRWPKYIGKPDPAMADISMRLFGKTKEETIVVGDRLETDIACGVNAGVDTAVVFTGSAHPEDIADSPVKPTWGFADIEAFRQALMGEE